MKKLAGSILFLTLFILLNGGCKKKHDSASQCRIVRLTKDGTQTYDLTYGSNGKLSSILLLPANQKTLFSYEGNKTIATVTQKGKFDYRMIVDNNASGLATNVRYEEDQAGIYWFNLAYTYKGRKLATNMITDVALDTTKASYIWENDNLAVLVSEGDVFHFKYYTDKPYQPGDWRYIQQLITGYWIYDYKNLYQSEEINGHTTYFTYQYDANGRIIEATSTATNYTMTYKIEYACDQ
jgi:YD repeat-containing protein